MKILPGSGVRHAELLIYLVLFRNSYVNFVKFWTFMKNGQNLLSGRRTPFFPRSRFFLPFVRDPATSLFPPPAISSSLRVTFSSDHWAFRDPSSWRESPRRGRFYRGASYWRLFLSARKWSFPLIYLARPQPLLSFSCIFFSMEISSPNRCSLAYSASVPHVLNLLVLLSDLVHTKVGRIAPGLVTCKFSMS